jgi:chromate reductase, NAD(P)H dehydrogenase (quinone)
MRILAISGSLRRDSHNTTLLRAAAQLVPADVEVAIWEGLREIPPYDDDTLDAPPRSVELLRDEVGRADAVLISTPEYNSSIPGQLKNALDWLSRPLESSPLRNKPAAVVGASTGMFGAVWAQAEVRKVLGAVGARVLDQELPVSAAHEQFTPSGRLVDSALEEAVASILADLIEAAEQHAQLSSVADTRG